jgi:hypothetical protein
MKATVVSCFGICLFLSLSGSGARRVLAGQKSCTAVEAKRALENVDHLKDWDAVHRVFIRFGHCDDGAIAEGYSDTVGRLLAKDWKHFGDFAELGRSDPKFENFVLRHIDETLPIDVLKAITDNAQKSCPADKKVLCRKIWQNAKSAGPH